MTRDEIIDLFIQNAAKVAAEPIRVATAEEFNRVLAEALKGSDSVYCADGTEKEKAVSISPERRSGDYVTAAVCVEEVAAAIAETGSIICTSHRGKAVQAGLLPPHHVAIVSAENVHEKLDDFFVACGDSPPTNVTLETGPSRTADIELTLTIGVHGPERLTIIVF